MTAVATWSTHGLREDQARDASEGKLADLSMAWALTSPPRDRFDWSVRYRKVDMLTVGKLQSGRLAEFRPAFASNRQSFVGVVMNLSGRLRCTYRCGGEFVLEPGVRTLQQLFSDAGTTVSSWIRERRLKACYRALSSADLSETVTEVAFRWGFNDAAHFSRRFKEAFGVTPSSVLVGCRSQHIDRRIVSTSRHHGPYDGTAG